MNVLEIDLNADVGEGCDDGALMPFLTSVSIACGGHAGDARSMADTVAAAIRFGLAIGAHPSYPDRESFGRRDMVMPADELEASIRAQIRALREVVAQAGARLAHVKPHGALYNRSARDPGIARVIATAVAREDPSSKLLGLAGSASLAAAREAGLVAVAEAFADRRYAADGSLTPRSVAGSVMEDPGAAAEQAAGIVLTRHVVAIDGTRIAMHARTLCIHGDTPGAAAIARAVRRRLEHAAVQITAP